MSSKELVISANRHETKVALLEDDQLVEVYFQRANEYSLAGSIHKGRVTRVLPGMQSAFVDVGLERDTFLYVSDFFDENDEYDKLPTGREESGGRGERPMPRPNPRIQQRPEQRPHLEPRLFESDAGGRGGGFWRLGGGNGGPTKSRWTPRRSSAPQVSFPRQTRLPPKQDWSLLRMYPSRTRRPMKARRKTESRRPF